MGGKIKIAMEKEAVLSSAQTEKQTIDHSVFLHSMRPSIDEKLPLPPSEIEKENIGATIPNTRQAGMAKHEQDADEAMKAFQTEDGEVIVLDEATNRRLLRKIDLMILPIMCVIYG